MSKTEQDYTQPLGLDVGTNRIVVARTAERENVFHQARGSDIVVAGNDAQRFAEVFHVETRRPMLDGVLNPHEPHSLAVEQRIITKMIGRAASPGQKIFFSVPAP